MPSTNLLNHLRRPPGRLRRREIVGAYLYNRETRSCTNPAKRQRIAANANVDRLQAGLTCEVDLVVSNRTPADLVHRALRDGILSTRNTQFSEGISLCWEGGSVRPQEVAVEPFTASPAFSRARLRRDLQRLAQRVDEKVGVV